MSLLGLFGLGMMCMTVICIALMVALSMPQSRMPNVMKHVLIIVGCALYVVSPIDCLPECLLGPIGGIDDLVAVVLGVAEARKALRARDEVKA